MVCLFDHDPFLNGTISQTILIGHHTPWVRKSEYLIVETKVGNLIEGEPIQGQLQHVFLSLKSTLDPAVPGLFVTQQNDWTVVFASIAGCDACWCYTN